MGHLACATMASLHYFYCHASCNQAIENYRLAPYFLLGYIYICPLGRRTRNVGVHCGHWKDRQRRPFFRQPSPLGLPREKHGCPQITGAELLETTSVEELYQFFPAYLSMFNLLKFSFALSRLTERCIPVSLLASAGLPMSRRGYFFGPLSWKIKNLERLLWQLANQPLDHPGPLLYWMVPVRGTGSSIPDPIPIPENGHRSHYCSRGK